MKIRICRDIDKSGSMEKTEMIFEMIPCSEDDREFIEEQTNNAFNAIAQPEEVAEEEFVYIVTDDSGNLLGGCILSVDDLRTASIYASCMYHPTYNDYVGLMEDYLSDTSKKVFVYEDRGKKTGLMVLKISEDAAEIIGIAVSDNARRKGIGTQLIQRVMESEDLKSVKAQTDDDSIGFYRKCGFSDERIVIEYPDGAAVRYNCVLHK